MRIKRIGVIVVVKIRLITTADTQEYVTHTIVKNPYVELRTFTVKNIG